MYIEHPTPHPPPPKGYVYIGTGPLPLPIRSHGTRSYRTTRSRPDMILRFPTPGNPWLLDRDVTGEGAETHYAVLIESEQAQRLGIVYLDQNKSEAPGISVTHEF